MSEWVSRIAILIEDDRVGDLLSSDVVMSKWVSRIAILIENDRVGDLRKESLGNRDVRLRRVPGCLCWGSDDLGSKGSQCGHLLSRHLLRQDDYTAVSPDCSRQGKSNPSVPRRRLDDRVPRLQLASLLSVLNHTQSNSVFHRTSRIEEFAFCQHFTLESG